MLDKLFRRWKKEQSARWETFEDSLTPEQRAMLQDYRKASSAVRKLRIAKERERRGRKVDISDVPDPDDGVW